MINASNNNISSRSILANMDWLAAGIYLTLLLGIITNNSLRSFYAALKE
jgi:hypothetical protein